MDIAAGPALFAVREVIANIPAVQQAQQKLFEVGRDRFIDAGDSDARANLGGAGALGLGSLLLGGAIGVVKALRDFKVNRATKQFTSDVHTSLEQALNVGELAKFRQIDPNAKIGLTGSAATGKVGNPNKPNFGQPINQEKFDLDLFVQSDKLFEQFGTKLRAAPELRKFLVENNSDLFNGLKPGKAGLSIKFKPNSDELNPGSVIFGQN